MALTQQFLLYVTCKMLPSLCTQKNRGGRRRAFYIFFVFGASYLHNVKHSSKEKNKIESSYPGTAERTGGQTCGCSTD